MSSSVEELTVRESIAELLRRRALMEAPNAAAALNFMAKVINANGELPEHMLGEVEYQYRRVSRLGLVQSAEFEDIPELDEGWFIQRRTIGPWEEVQS